MFKRILVPLDGSPGAESALAPARFLAAASGGELLLVRAGEPIIPSLQVLDLSEDPLLNQRREITKYLEAIARPEQRESYRVLEEGNAAQVILDEAERSGVDAIVLCSHGRTGVSRFLLGSVAEKVARHARCPVMIVRRPPHK